ncbi:MAG: hypothetical protein CL674_08760 [Bdellovibrionaceae bacterium]|nr:hypothetical protein [Pseudobdellovibrionaceae bacterium]
MRIEFNNNWKTFFNGICPNVAFACHEDCKEIQSFKMLLSAIKGAIMKQKNKSIIVTGKNLGFLGE